MSLRLFDSHAHLQWDIETDPLDDRLNRAREVGVTDLMCVGIDLESSHHAAAIASAHEHVLASIGLHPNDLAKDRGQLDADLGEVDSFAATLQYSAIGETGLDFYHQRSNPDDQHYSFRRHLEIAADNGLAVIIHCREAITETLEVLRQHRQQVRGVMHCWSGTVEDVEPFLEIGLHISFAGNCTYPGNLHLRESAKVVPTNRILVETDAPFLSPQARRGKRNEPAFIVHTLECLAEQRGEELATTADYCWNNANELFQRAQT